MFAFPLVFIALPGFDRASPEALLVFYIPLVLIFKFGWAMTQVSHLSMIPELSNDATDRDDMTILRYTVPTSVHTYLIMILFCNYITFEIYCPYATVHFILQIHFRYGIRHVSVRRNLGRV